METHTEIKREMGLVRLISLFKTDPIYIGTKLINPETQKSIEYQGYDPIKKVFVVIDLANQKQGMVLLSEEDFGNFILNGHFSNIHKSDSNIDATIKLEGSGVDEFRTQDKKTESSPLGEILTNKKIPKTKEDVDFLLKFGQKLQSEPDLAKKVLATEEVKMKKRQEELAKILAKKEKEKERKKLIREALEREREDIAKTEERIKRRREEMTKKSALPAQPQQPQKKSSFWEKIRSGFKKVTERPADEEKPKDKQPTKILEPVFSLHRQTPWVEKLIGESKRRVRIALAALGIGIASTQATEKAIDLSYNQPNISEPVEKRKTETYKINTENTPKKDIPKIEPEDKVDVLKELEKQLAIARNNTQAGKGELKLADASAQGAFKGGVEAARWSFLAQPVKIAETEEKVPEPTTVTFDGPEPSLVESVAVSKIPDLLSREKEINTEDELKAINTEDELKNFVCEKEGGEEAKNTRWKQLKMLPLWMVLGEEINEYKDPVFAKFKEVVKYYNDIFKMDAKTETRELFKNVFGRKIASK